VRAKEFISELYFMGSPCTKDCSGHKAGYAWGKSHGGDEAFGPSPSFNKGTYLAKNYTPRAQGGGKIKFKKSKTSKQPKTSKLPKTPKLKSRLRKEFLECS
jgi:hypothetical protein